MTAENVPITSPITAGLRGRCPRCSTGRLFEGGALSLAVRERCESCDLDLRFVDAGDGPAVFAIFVLGVLMLGTALFVEFRFAPPLWLHVVIFAPLTLLTAIGLLRPIKGMLIAQQYSRKAEEGRLARDRDRA